MKVKCCWNEAHDSTITEDRANPVFGGGLGGGAQSLAGRGIERILAVWKRGLKRRENVPFGEFFRRCRGRESGGVAPVNLAAHRGEKNPRTQRGFR